MLIGDGAFNLTSQVVATAVEYDLPAIWVILNNYEFGIERKGMERCYSRSHPWCHFSRKDTGERYNPDYVKLAHAYGAEGVRIEDPAELAPTLTQGDRQPPAVDHRRADRPFGRLLFHQGHRPRLSGQVGEVLSELQSAAKCRRLNGRRIGGGEMAMRKAEARSEARTATAVSSGDVIEELRRNYDRLTQSQKRIAEFIVEHPQSVAFSTVDQMAAQLDVNPSTIVRFTYRLGLKGFPGLAGAHAGTGARPAFAHRRPDRRTPGRQRTSRGHEFRRVRSATIGRICIARSSRPIARSFEQAIKLLVRSRRVYVVAGFSTYPVAHYFAMILDRIRTEITLLAAHDTFATIRLAEIEADDCVVAFTFPRYASATHRVAVWAKEHGARSSPSPIRRFPRSVRSPTSCCWRPRPAPGCRTRWLRRWRSPTRCSTASWRPRGRARWSATAAMTV